MIADLLRHGVTTSSGFRGRLDDPLTAEGWQQMRHAVANRHDWQVIVSSPLRRCAEFAEALAEERLLPLHIETRLAELDFGAWEGKTAEALMRHEEDAAALRRFWNDPWQHPPPEGESLDAFAQRIHAAWQELTRAYAGTPTLIVTHGGVIRLLLCQSRRLERRKLLEIDVPHASLHRILLQETITP